MSLAERLKELRTEKGLTQKELANLLDISPSAIAMYEVKRRDPDTNTLIKIADVFGVSIDYLVGKTDIRNHKEAIARALVDEPELYQFWDKLKERPDLQLLFKQTKDMSPNDIKTIIRIIKAIEDEEDNLY